MNLKEKIGKYDILFVTFDTLRYDVAYRGWVEHRLPNLAAYLPKTGWECRHAPGNFTFASHAAFFAGFLPTPITPGRHTRLFGLRFDGSETIDENTIVFDAPNIVVGLSAMNYRTICIGGVGFFNKRNPLGCVFPSMFDESHWSEEFSVIERNSTRHQFELAHQRLQSFPSDERVFLFINLSALHQPNCFYLPDVEDDNCDSQLAALEYVDSQWPILMESLRMRGSGFGILCSDHGTAYGEDGYVGHRLAHPVVWDVPDTEISWKQA